MFQHVRPTKVLAALEWLKVNNPLFQDVAINTDWEQQASQDDAEPSFLSTLLNHPVKNLKNNQQWINLNRTVSLILVVRIKCFISHLT